MISAWQAIKERVRPYYLRGAYFPLVPAARPDEFRACWENPVQALTPGGFLSPARSSQPVFLFLPMIDWHSRIQRSQQLARALSASGSRCFYLNPNMGRQFPTLYRFDRGPKASRIGDAIFELHVRLPREPVFHHRILSDLESSLLAGQLARLRALCPGPVVQVLSLPTWLGAAQQLRTRFGWPILYDCHDLLAGFDTTSRSVVQSEPKLLEEAAHVLFASTHLANLTLERFPGLESKCSVIHNAADFDHFAPAADRPAPGPSPVAGYVGAIEDWFDAEAIRLAAERNPRFRFRLIGRVDNRRVAALRSLPNVELLGEIPYAKLPAHLANFDLGLLPFRDTPLTRSASPIKIFEYFAAGLPVVARRLPETARLDPLLVLAQNSAHFADCIEPALASDSSSARQARMEWAQRESWSERAASLQAIADVLAFDSSRAGSPARVRPLDPL
ncbi:MAG: glycosyltransferase [Bryobacteraceae bacterium]